MRRAKGQASFEYILVVGLALVLLVPGTYLFYSFSKVSNDQVVGARINGAGNELLGTVEEVYAVGQNSWRTVTINFPDNVRNVYVLDDEELVITYDTQNGVSDAVFFSKVNISAPYGGNISLSFTPGLTKVKVSSLGSYVSLE